MDSKQTTGFSHITVGVDDDEVIVAGVTDQPTEKVYVAPEPEPELAPEPEPEPAPEPKPEPASKPAAASARKKDEYHETTLEDLQGAPMPLAQKIVLVCAAVLIVVCVAYYFGVIAH